MEFRTNRVVSLTLYAIAFAGVALGIFARLHQIGAASLNTDEYYFARSVQFILENGVPEFPGGGYYVRALPLQYLGAAVCGLLGDSEMAHRLPAAAFGILTLMAFYFLAREFIPSPLAIGATALLALSSWEIEFSRFARMYSLFQFLTVAFFYTFYRAYVRGERRLQYMPHAIALLAVVVHVLGVFLTPFLFAPLLMNRFKRDIFYTLNSNRLLIALGLVTMCAAVAYLRFEDAAWYFGVPDPYPDDWSSAYTPPLARNAMFPFFGTAVQPVQMLLLFGVLAGTVSLAILARNRWKFDQAAVPVGITILFVSALLHLLSIYFFVLGILVWRYDFHRALFQQRRTAVLFALTCLLVAGWACRAAYDLSWAHQSFPGDLAKAARFAFFGLPDFYTPGVAVWMHTVPLFSAFLGVCIGGELIRIRKQPWKQILSNPAIVPVYFFLVFGFYNPQYNSTRYWFFIYPLMVLAAFIGMRNCFLLLAARYAPNRIWTGCTAPFVAVSLVFIFTEDFHLKQTVQPGDPFVILRTGKYERLDSHWYPRRDERTPAAFLNEIVALDEKVIVSGLLTSVPYYLEKDLAPAVFMDRDHDPRYHIRSRKKGTKELWTGYRLLGTRKELHQYAGAATELYVVKLVKPHALDIDPEKVWKNSLRGTERVSLSSDGRIEVVKLLLTPPGDF